MGVRSIYIAFSIVLAVLCGGCAASGDHRMWASQYGGVQAGTTAARVEAIAQRLQVGLAGLQVQSRVLRTDLISAFSFPDGSIYLTHGLVERASDEELAAAIAHELGHLLIDGHVRGPAALRGNDRRLDTEAEADALGCRILETHGIAYTAMARMLQLVAADRTCHAPCDDLRRRICRLQAQMRTGAQ